MPRKVRGKFAEGFSITSVIFCAMGQGCQVQELRLRFSRDSFRARFSQWPRIFLLLLSFFCGRGCPRKVSRSINGKTKEGGQSQKKKVEKPQDGRQKSSQNIGNPYQMEDNKAAPSAPPQGGGASRRPLGVLVVFHLVRISYVWA